MMVAALMAAQETRANWLIGYVTTDNRGGVAYGENLKEVRDIATQIDNAAIMFLPEQIKGE
jgi:hypothetical protein